MEDKSITIEKTFSIGDSGMPFHCSIDVEYTETDRDIIVHYCMEDESPWDNPPELWYKMIEEAVSEYFYELNPNKEITFYL